MDAFFERYIHLIKGNEWLETNNTVKCKFRNVAEKMVWTVVSNRSTY
jgi:hypothetical protein